MKQIMKVTLCEDRFKKPLAVLDLPGPGIELRPEQIRLLAAALLEIADDCEARKIDKKHYTAETRFYPWFP